MTPEPPLPESFWVEATGRLAQGDYLLNCPAPEFPADYGDREESAVDVRDIDLIVITQSCDLENEKVSLVAMCPIWTVEEFQELDPEFKRLHRLEEVRKGRFEGLHMLSSTTLPANNSDARIVDFREIYSLPRVFLESHVSKQGKRWQLRSPYLEHFSQSFARFFMRVGLPSAIPKFK